MIYMFLSPFEDLGENELFWGQRPLQVWSQTLVSIVADHLNLMFCPDVYAMLNIADYIVDVGYSCSALDAFS